jgi:hypothetical protein
MRDDAMAYERSALSAVLLGQTGRPRGSRPSEGELAAWAGRRLSGYRLFEVESHIALDPQVFAAAMQQLRGAASATVSSLPVRLARALASWMTRPLPALAAVAAAVALVAVVLTQLNVPGTGPGAGHSVLRGSADSPSDWRIVAFRAGYWEKEAAVAARRADERADAFGCVDEEGCGPQVEQLVRFGVVLAHVNASCGVGLDAAQRGALADQLEAIETGMATSLELLPWRNYARDLSSDLRSGSTRACDRAEALRALLIAD